MGVTWGIVRYDYKYFPKGRRKEILEDWRPLAELCNQQIGFCIMHGGDRINFRRAEIQGEGERWRVEVTETAEPETLRRLEGLVTGDGTHGVFEQLFDGYQLFVPWQPPHWKIDSPGSVVDGHTVASLDSLELWMTGILESPPSDPTVARLARELLNAAKFARSLNMIIQIHF